MLKAFAEIKSAVQLEILESALRSEGINGALRILSSLQIEGIIEKHLVDDLNEAIMESGRYTITLMPVGAVNTGTVFYYSILNPITTDYIRTYELNLIRNIGANSRTAIRNSIEADIIAGNNPKSTARAFKNAIGLTPRQEQAVRNYKNHLQNLDAEALKRQLRDPRFDATITNAIRNNQKLTDKQIEKMVTAYRNRYISYRAKTIARTESMRAMSVGEYTSAIQAVNDGAIERDSVRRFWVYADDKRTRNAHRQISGLNPNGVEVDQPFVTPLGPLLFPRDPNGSAANTVNCRCTVIYKIME